VCLAVRSSHVSRVTDSRALRIGLVNMVVPLSELEASVNEFCRKIIRNSKDAIRRTKSLIDMAMYSNPDGFRGENQGFAEAFASGEPEERLTAFMESDKRRKAS